MDPGIPQMADQAFSIAGLPPVPPKQLKNLIEGTVGHHASTAFPGLQEVTVRWRGPYGYLTA